MASEQLKYDFELNLARAEKNIDRFITNFETRLDRVSGRMERSLEKISRGAASGAGSRGAASGGLEREVDRMVRRQSSVQRDLARQQKQRERELAADKARFQREEDRRVLERDRRRTQTAKRLEREEAGRNRIVDTYEQKRRSRRDTLDNLSSRAELRSRNRLDGIDFSQEDDGALSKALAARKRFADSVNKIMQESSWKSLATVRTEVAREEAIYRGALNRIAAKNTARKSAGGGGFFAGGKGVQAAFNVQQMIEDYQYAGWRGVSNNLGFLGASLGGKAGLAVIVGVAAKGLYDLGASMAGVGDQADKLSARVDKARSSLDAMIAARRRLADEEVDFTVPESPKDMTRRLDDLRRREMKVTNTPDLDLANSEISKLKELQRIYSELRRGGNFFDPLGTGSGVGEWAQYLGTGPTSPIGIGMGVAGTRLDMATTKRLRAQYKNIQGTLSDPNLAANPDGLQKLIDKREEDLAIALRTVHVEEQSIQAERERLETFKQVFELKSKAAEIEDEVTDKLREQQRAEERLADTARDRAKSVRDAILSASDNFENRMLDTKSDALEKRFEKWTERAVDADKRHQTNMFNQMYPNAGPDQKEAFENWLQQRGEAVRGQGENMLYGRQFRLAQERAKFLKSRADSETAMARHAARRGDMDEANSGYEKAVKSLEQIQELNFQFQAKGNNPARSQAWLNAIQDFQKDITSIQNEQAQANDKFAESHKNVTKELEATETRLKDITKRIELMSASDEKAVEPWKKVNEELDGTLKRLKELEDMKKSHTTAMPGSPGGGNAEGPVGAAVGQITVQRAVRRAKEAAAREKRKLTHNSPGTGFVPADRWGAQNNFQGVAKAEGYMKLVKSALKSKWDELSQNPANIGIRNRLLGSAYRSASPVFHELEDGEEVSQRRGEQLAETLKSILEEIKAIQGAGPIKIPVEIIERRISVRGPDGKYQDQPNWMMGMPRGFRGVKYRAAGGPVSKSSPYIVGENGQELFIPNTGGQIVNATDTRRMLSGGQQPAASLASTTSNTFNANYGGITIQTANVDLAEIQRKAEWRQKASKSRMGN